MYLLAIDLFFILEKLILIALVITLSMIVAMYATYGERKVAAFMQDRIGPNRAGPFGLLQPLADGGKLFFKEEIIPLASSKFLFVLGPVLAYFKYMFSYRLQMVHAIKSSHFIHFDWL